MSERAECDDGEACGNDDPGYVATESRPGSKRAGCIAHNCLRGPFPDLALCAILRPSPCDERGGQHGCASTVKLLSTRFSVCAEHAFLEARDVRVAARRLNDLAERREEKTVRRNLSAWLGSHFRGISPFASVKSKYAGEEPIFAFHLGHCGFCNQSLSWRLQRQTCSRVTRSTTIVSSQDQRTPSIEGTVGGTVYALTEKDLVIATLGYDTVYALESVVTPCPDASLSLVRLNA